MKLSMKPITLNLKTTFRIAHGASDQRFNVIVSLQQGDLVGYGEAAAVAYHGETQEGIMAYLEKLRGTEADPSQLDDPFLLEEYLMKLPVGSNAARAALDIALHDLLGKTIGQPLYRIFGLNPEKLPQTSFTIAIDHPETMAERARESELPILKIKLGKTNDLEIIDAIRKVTSARLRVDANAGWSREQAAKIIPQLVQYDLEMIEQPLSVGNIEGLRWLRAQNYGVPFFADESIKNARDVAAHAGAVDGVVIKLMKTGGLREALRAIHVARALDMKIMIGCMVESSLGVTAASHLAPLCDFADLDGPLLISNDPFQGVHYDDAQLELTSLPGLGVSKRDILV